MSDIDSYYQNNPEAYEEVKSRVRAERENEMHEAEIHRRKLIEKHQLTYLKKERAKRNKIKGYK